MEFHTGAFVALSAVLPALIFLKCYKSAWAMIKERLEFKGDRHPVKADRPQASCMPGADQFGRTDYISLEPNFTY